MDMYELFIKERANLDTIRTDKGFITYEIKFPNCIINNLFVLKEHRQSGHANFLGDQVFQICKDAGVKTVYCSTDDRARGVEVSTAVIENFGFKFFMKSGPISDYTMEVSEWEKR